MTTARIFVDCDVNGAQFGERIGYFGLRSYDEDERNLLNMAIVNNAGYPHEAAKPMAHCASTSTRVRTRTSAFWSTWWTQPADKVVVRCLSSTRKNQRYVVAIHTTGNFINRGVRVTAEVYDKILEWVK